MTGGDGQPTTDLTPKPPLPGRELLSALPLAGLALMTINDRLLRPRWPGLITGKLSDFAVVLFFPFLLTATIGWLAWLLNLLARLGGSRSPSLQIDLTRGRLWAAMAATAFALVVINLSVAARDLYVAALHRIDITGLIGPFRYTLDPTDCLALVVLPVVWWWGQRQMRQATGRD